MYPKQHKMNFDLNHIHGLQEPSISTLEETARWADARCDIAA